MKVPPQLLKALNVRKDEWWLVQKLFLLQFFQGAGIAFFFTSAFSRFLEHFPISGLAYVYILSSFLLWIAGFVYSKLEHHCSPERLCTIITIVLASSMLLFWAGAEGIRADWFYYLMLAWFSVLYLLNNMMFWGIASQLYDVRQSKRLFGVISAGDIPAKFIGYTVALLIVSHTGTIHLLLAGFIFIMISFPFLNKILHKGKHALSQHVQTAGHSGGLNSIVKDYSVNILVRRVALLSLIVTACIILINYGFYAEVKHAYKDDVALASFIALFLAIARLISLVIKIVVTSRLVYWLGNRIALVITPVILVVFLFILLLTDTLSTGGKTILYIFGLAAIGVDALRSAINAPILLTMMQPLSGPARLRAHNIVKGIMDPFANFLSGLILLFFFKMDWYSLESLCYVLLGLAIAWIIGIFRVHQQYLKTLIKTISSRFFTQEEFNLYDTAARELIAKKIDSGTELEVLYILKMLSSQRTEESNKLIIQALDHSSEKVTGEALRLVSSMHIKEAEPRLSQMIKNYPSEAIRGEAIKVLAKIAFHDPVIVPLMDSNDQLIRRSAIISILNHSHSEENKNIAENKLKRLLASGNAIEKKEAAEMLSETSNMHFDTELIQLLNEQDISLQLAAIKAIGHHATSGCLEQLIKKLEDHEKPVVESLVVAREKALPFIKTRIISENCPAKQRDSLINALGRIGGHSTHEILLELVPVLPGYEHYIIKVLHRCHFKAGKQNLKMIEDLTRDQLVMAAAILHMQKNIAPLQDTYILLTGSLQLELYKIRETLLFLFSFLYDREQISKVKAAIEINRKETNANAIEWVDMTVKKEFANPFNAAFEFGDIEHRCTLLKNLFPKDIFPGVESIIAEILTDKAGLYYSWTKSCSLYLSKKNSIPLEKELVSKYLHDDNQVLKETAFFSIQNN